MAMVTTASRGGGEWKEKEKEKEKELCLLQKAKAWSELRNGHSPEKKKKVAVVYYLSRNGHLEHPHFMEVPLSSPSDGLYLKDVINRLSALRGWGLAGLYSWAAKRSYRNGYVWHDLTEEDFIHPVHGNEYVLKGTELLNLGPVSVSRSETSVGTTSSSSVSSTEKVLEPSKSSSDLSASSIIRSQKNNNNGVSNGPLTDASTQTDDERRCRRRQAAYTPSNSHLTVENNNKGELMTSSPETLQALVNYDRRILDPDNGRETTSAVLMHLISCGSIAVKGQQSVLPPPSNGERLAKEFRDEIIGGSCRFSERGKMGVVEKECFSGSLLMESSSKEDAAAAEIAAVLKKCSSFTAERGMKKKLESPKEVGGMQHSRCMPRNSKVSRGSKRFNT